MKIYVRYEPTTDENLRSQYVSEHDKKLLAKKNDVVGYLDEDCTEFLIRWPWHYKSKPKKNTKYRVVNCSTWELVWVDDYKESFAESIEGAFNA